MNKFKKSFVFEEQLIATAKQFILNDQEKHGYINFDKDYIQRMDEYRKLLNDRFCGRSYRLNLQETEPGSLNFVTTEENYSANFGNDWEDLVKRELERHRISYGFRAWPKGPGSFPDFCEGNLIGDSKTIMTKVYKKNSMFLKPAGSADLCFFDTFSAGLDSYKKTGKLDEHQSALLVIGVYSDHEKHATVEDVIVIPALFAVKFHADHTFYLRHEKVQVSMFEHNLSILDYIK